LAESKPEKGLYAGQTGSCCPVGYQTGLSLFEKSTHFKRGIDWEAQNPKARRIR